MCGRTHAGEVTDHRRQPAWLQVCRQAAGPVQQQQLPWCLLCIEKSSCRNRIQCCKQSCVLLLSMAANMPTLFSCLLFRLQDLSGFEAVHLDPQEPQQHHMQQQYHHSRGTSQDRGSSGSPKTATGRGSGSGGSSNSMQKQGLGLGDSSSQASTSPRIAAAGNGCSCWGKQRVLLRHGSCLALHARAPSEDYGCTATCTHEVLSSCTAYAMPSVPMPLMLICCCCCCYSFAVARRVPQAGPAGARGHWRLQRGAVARRGAGSSRAGEGAAGEGRAPASCTLSKRTTRRGCQHVQMFQCIVSLQEDTCVDDSAATAARHGARVSRMQCVTSVARAAVCWPCWCRLQ